VYHTLSTIALRLILAIFFVSMGLESCKLKTDYQREIKAIDSTISILDSCKNTLIQIDSASLQSKCFDLANILSGDTIKKDNALLLSKQVELSKNIQNLLNNKHSLELALHESIKQLSNLKQDLSFDLITKNNSQQFVVNEINESQRILSTIESAIKIANTSANQLDSIQKSAPTIADTQ